MTGAQPWSLLVDALALSRFVYKCCLLWFISLLCFLLLETTDNGILMCNVVCPQGMCAEMV
jgi:hypothetical protein